MFKRYYIEVRDPTRELKEFYLYDNYGELVRALRSLPKSGRPGTWRPNKDTTVTFHEDYQYIGHQFSEYIPNRTQIYLGILTSLSSLLVLSAYEIEEMSESVPRTIIDAAKELEMQRLRKGYFRGLANTYWNRYRHLYLALAALVISSITVAYFFDCRTLSLGRRDIFIFGVGTLVIGAFVYRHFMSWTPAIWLSGLGALLLILAGGSGGNLYCCYRLGPYC